MSRKAMEMYGSDVRLFLEFDRWVRHTRPSALNKRKNNVPHLLR
jgi:hypothetical protein